MSELYSILDKLTPDAPLSTGEKFGVEQKVLLWENADAFSSSTFAGQTLSITDIGNYDELEMVWGDYNQNDTRVTYGLNSSTYRSYHSTQRNVGGIDAHCFERNTQLTSSGLYISDCMYTDLAQTSYGTSNVYMKPYRIYGIKKVGSD